MTRRPVLAYSLLTFAVSWGGFVVVGGPGIWQGTDWESDPRFLAAVSALLLGPPLAGVLCTRIFGGPAGLADLRSRMSRWRVAPRWYAAALLTAPAVQLVVLGGLAVLNPAYLPDITRSEDRAGLLVAGVVVGLAGGLAEELGWTGFALPRLRARFTDRTTGLVMGVLWGTWHLPQMWWVGRTSQGAVPAGLYLPGFFLTAVAALTAFRMLMVQVYARTESLMLLVLMHASYIWTTLFALAPPREGGPFLLYSAVFVLVLAGLAAWVTRASARHPEGGDPR